MTVFSFSDLTEPIEFKAGAKLDDLAKAGLSPLWQKREEAFLASLRSARIGAIIFDFDGTVYSGGQLNNAIPDDEIRSLLTGLLERGMALGFASGRGLSLRDALRQTFARKFWHLVFAAYQDGAEVGRLDDDSLPSPHDPAYENPLLARVRKTLENIFAGWPNPPEIRAENQLVGLRSNLRDAQHVFETCCGIALPLGLKMFKSGRMIDITLTQVSKRNLEAHLARKGLASLAIGDAGAWPGNDCELLASPHGLSVGSVSADPACCWRITRTSGPAATCEILAALKHVQNDPENVMRLDWRS